MSGQEEVLGIDTDKSALDEFVLKIVE